MCFFTNRRSYSACIMVLPLYSKFQDGCQAKKNELFASDSIHVTIHTNSISVSVANCSSSNFSSTSSSSTPVSTAVSGHITPVIYNVAVGMKSYVSTSPNMVPVLTISTSPCPDAGSVRTATVGPSATSALIQWLAKMQQNKASLPQDLPLVNLSPIETTPYPL